VCALLHSCCRRVLVALQTASHLHPQHPSFTNRSSLELVEAVQMAEGECPASKKGSPLRWTRTQQGVLSAGVVVGGGCLNLDAQPLAEPEVGPMTKQRALHAKPSAPPLAGQPLQQPQSVASSLVMAGRGARALMNQDSDIGATVSGLGDVVGGRIGGGSTAGGATQHMKNAPVFVLLAALLSPSSPQQGPDINADSVCGGRASIAAPPAPICSDSPDLAGHKGQQLIATTGPLAAGRIGKVAPSAAAAAAAAPGARRGRMNGGGSGKDLDAAAAATAAAPRKLPPLGSIGNLSLEHSGNFLGNLTSSLFGCFAPPPVREATVTAA